MTLEELIETYPEAETYFKNMPEELKTRYTIRSEFFNSRASFRTDQCRP